MWIAENQINSLKTFQTWRSANRAQNKHMSALENIWNKNTSQQATSRRAPQWHLPQAHAPDFSASKLPNQSSMGNSLPNLSATNLLDLPPLTSLLRNITIGSLPDRASAHKLHTKKLARSFVNAVSSRPQCIRQIQNIRASVTARVSRLATAWPGS